MFILGIVLIFYFSLPRLSIRMNRTFVNMLIIQSGVIFFDVVSSWADNNYQEMSASVLYLLNAAYFVLFYARAFVFFVFTANVFRLDPTDNKLRTFLLRSPFFISSALAVISPWNGLIFWIGADGYHSGPLYNVLYVVSYFYLAMSFYAMFRYRSNVRKRRYRFCMILFNSIILIGVILRWTFPTFLLMDTFCLMAIIVVYLAFENPEFYLDLRGTVFNSNAFKDYFAEHNGNLSNRLLGVVVHNYYDMRDVYGGKQMDVGINMISAYLTETFEGYSVFYYRRGRFLILGPKNMSFDRIMDQINERFEQPWTGDNMELYLEPGYVTVDLGKNVSSADGFLNALIAAMEQASKQDSREPVSVSDFQIKDNENEVLLKRALEKAIEDDRIEVFLQPLVEARTEKVVGAEALCRIRDVNGNMIPPYKFIPLAEKNGRINILGELVFEKTCRFIKENDIKAGGISWINVNLSPMQFMKSDLAERYDAIIKKYGIDPGMIHMEITEESIIDEGFLHKQIQAMQGKGFMFVLDDYGTGYSNLTRLKKCPFINIKLDMSLIRDYYSEPDEILPNMIRAFKNMKFGITAEGIEDKGMADAFREIGCDYLQGFHYSRPISMADFTERYLKA